MGVFSWFNRFGLMRYIMTGISNIQPPLSANIWSQSTNNSLVQLATYSHFTSIRRQMSSRSADSQLFQARNCRSPICTLYAFFYINPACIFLQHLWQKISILLKCRNFARLDHCCWNACARALMLVSWTMCGMRS